MPREPINHVEAEVRKGRRAVFHTLARWTQHAAECERRGSTAGDCTCGLDEAWRSLEAEHDEAVRALEGILDAGRTSQDVDGWCYARQLRDIASDALIAMRASPEGVVSEIMAERAAQDAKWGGQAHDDQHMADAWSGFIREHNERAGQAAGIGPSHSGETWRQQMIRVAALAIAAVESYDRRTGRMSDAMRSPDVLVRVAPEILAQLQSGGFHPVVVLGVHDNGDGTHDMTLMKPEPSRSRVSTDDDFCPGCGADLSESRHYDEHRHGGCPETVPDER